MRNIGAADLRACTDHAMFFISEVRPVTWWVMTREQSIRELQDIVCSEELPSGLRSIAVAQLLEAVGSSGYLPALALPSLVAVLTEQVNQQ